MRIYTLMLLLLIGLASNAQQLIRTVYNDISSKTDIPTDGINAVEQDDNGFVWAATWKGLYRFDGYKAINFSQINPAFKGQKITDVHYSSNGILWVSCFIDGVFAINTANYAVTHYHPNAEQPYKILDQNIIHIYESKAGEIWLGGESEGITVIGKQCTSFITTANSDLLKGQIPEIYPANKEQLFIGTGEGLQLYNLATRKFKQLFPNVFNDYIYDISQDKAGNFYIAHKGGLHRVTLKNNTPTIQTISTKLSSSVLFETNAMNSDLLVGCVDGLYRYSPKTDSISNINFTPSNSALNGHITDLFKTTDGTLFLATMSGLYNLYPQKKEFQPMRISVNKDEAINITAISGSQNRLWMGTWGNGLLLYNQTTQVKDVQQLTIGHKNFDPYINSVRCDGQFVWFSTKNRNGVFRFSINDIIGNRLPENKLKHFLQFQDQSGGQEKVVICISKTTDGELIFGTWEGELFLYDAVTDQIVRYPNTKNAAYSGIPINSIIKDKIGRLWLGTRGKGVYVIDKDSVHHYSKENGLSDNFVTQIYQSTNEKIWITTEKSLSMVDRDGQLKNYFQAYKRFDFQSITEDPSGFLWLGTRKGLIRTNSNLPPDTYKFFNNKDGLLNESFAYQSVYKDTEGKIYFGGTKGIDAFLSHQFVFNYKTPKVRLTDFLLFHKRVQEGVEYDNTVILNQSISRTSEITLSHQQNTFEIEFSNLQYILPEKAIYKYQLVGADKEWVFAEQGETRAYYTNLRWGEYVFLLKSCNNDGFWNDEPLQLTITIRPPFWATYWAYASYVLLVGCLIWFFTKRTIVKVKHLHSIEMKDFEYQKQKEVDEAKLRFFTNISHELRTPLTLIIGPLSRILQKGGNDPHKEYHLLMYRNADRLLKLISRLMDFSKNEQAKLILQVQNDDLVTCVEGVYASFSLEAAQKNIAYSIEVEPNTPTIWFDKEFLESIVFNLLSNAFKYTPADRSIRLVIRKSELKKEEAIAIAIIDEGKGIEKAEIDKIFERFYSGDKIHSGTGIGLSFTKRLIDMHRGEITVNSIPNKGTSFTVYLSANDIYTQQEKAIQPGDKEQIIDWRGIDTQLTKENTVAFDQLKQDTNKDQLIALVVDDNADVRTFVKSLLKDAFVILEAEDGEQGLSIAQELIPDIIVSDVMMPKMTGYEFCDAVKTDKRTDHIPVILMTVLSSQDDRIKGLRFGADAYIPKPINPEHLLVRVRNLLEVQNRLKKKFAAGQISIKDIATTDQSKSEENSIHPLVEKATKVVQEHLHLPEYSVDDFASDLGLSRMQLYRKLKAITGLSANVFIRKVRLQKAAELLAIGEFNVKQVTYDVGFNDLKYFRKCFKDEFGANPSDFLPSKEDGDEVYRGQ